jgi:hypothetical protein
VWRIGPRPELVGRPVDGQGGLEEVVDVERMATPASDGGVSPLVRFRVDGLQPGDPVAVTSAGQIIATALAARVDDHTEVVVMVDPSSVDTERDMRLWSIEG